MQKFILLLLIFTLFSGCVNSMDEVTFPDEETTINLDGAAAPAIPNETKQQVKGAYDRQVAQGNLPPLPQQPAATPTPTPDVASTLPEEPVPLKDYVATIKTVKGDIKVKLYGTKAPKTVANFVKKAKDGFYDGLTFHRVENWVIQGGDPLGNGTGGGTMPTEITDVPFAIGSLGVARGNDKAISNDSQFFICTEACDWLTGDYTNFGEVTEGMGVAQSIQKNDTIQSITIEAKDPGLTPVE